MSSGKKWCSAILCRIFADLSICNVLDSALQDDIDSLALCSKNGSYPSMLLNASPYTLGKTILEQNILWMDIS